jgi:class 3 adenylate cyclase/alpha-beta hydrolase superfamily lysophospholipase
MSSRVCPTSGGCSPSRVDVDTPETRYVAVGDADVAYQVIGDGPNDLLLCFGIGSHIEILWEHPVYADFILRLANFSRVILLDRRGTGASDGVPRTAIPTWEDWAEDFKAVLQAVGSTRTAMVALGDAGRIAALFAAMNPERLTHLVLINSSARRLWADDYPIGISPEAIDTIVKRVAQWWGTPDYWRIGTPSAASDDEFARFGAKMMRVAATPRSAAAQYEAMLRSDVRQALPLIQAPTLVIHTKDYPPVPLVVGQYLAEHIAGAALVELPGGDYVPTAASGKVMTDLITEFMTGERPPIEVDRLLTTVLFTDIVGSTELAASVGDNDWHKLLDSHDRVVREELRHFGGREIKTTGDGFVASFDGPARAIRCTQTIIDAAVRLGIKLRTGLHTGECEVRGDDLSGLAVHIAARVGALAAPQEVLVSRTVVDLVAGSGIEFADRGEHKLKGVPGTWRLYRVLS